MSTATPFPRAARPPVENDALWQLHAAATTSSTSAEKASDRANLSIAQCAGSVALLFAWLILFGAGIMVDSAPYRSLISLQGATAMAAEEVALLDGAASAAASRPVATASATVRSVGSAAEVGLAQLLKAWFVVLFSFLPLNLAWLCVASSTLGALGNYVNLSDDRPLGLSQDSTNPVISAILRGFFIYLFMMSGLLVLDDAPFSSPTPARYIRLAGFLSLFAFVVSYHPRLFSSLILSAFQRIQVRGAQDDNTQLRTELDQKVVVSTAVAVENTTEEKRDRQ